MNNETILYFADADLSGTGSGAYKASRFMGLDQTGATGATFYFLNEDFEVGQEDTAAVTFSGSFRDLARAVAGVINSKKAFVTMSDATNSEYFSYPGGVLSGIPTVTQN
jgi:hypothetical protein